jgi:hypothetical protein
MGHTIETSASLRAPLRHRPYLILLTGSTISSSGDWLYNVALAVYVFDRTGSAGGSPRDGAAPRPVCAPRPDRGDRRPVRSPKGPDLVRSAPSRRDGRGVLLVADGPVLAVTLLAFATTAFGTAYGPAMMEVTPSLVGEDDLAAANALNTLVDNLTIVIGPAIGAALLAVSSPVFAFSVNALTFLAPALLLTFGLRRLSPDADRETATDEAGALASHFLAGVRRSRLRRGACSRLPPRRRLRLRRADCRPGARVR